MTRTARFHTRLSPGQPRQRDTPLPSRVPGGEGATSAAQVRFEVVGVVVALVRILLSAFRTTASKCGEALD